MNKKTNLIFLQGAIAVAADHKGATSCSVCSVQHPSKADTDTHIAKRHPAELAAGAAFAVAPGHAAAHADGGTVVLPAYGNLTLNDAASIENADPSIASKKNSQLNINVVHSLFNLIWH